MLKKCSCLFGKRNSYSQKYLSQKVSTLRIETLGGRNFHRINFRDFGHESEKRVLWNLQNTKQPRKFVPRNLIIFKLKKKKRLPKKWVE